MSQEQRMRGKTCVITGGTSGIGEATAVALACQGADLALLCRSPERGAATRTRIAKESGRDCVRLFPCDFERLEDVRRASQALSTELDRIDVLLNNAGVTMARRHETPDGYETTFAVNHLAPFLLTHGLMSRLLERPGARIVNVASAAHRFARFDLEDLQSTRSYSAMRVYGASKLANILFTNELARRFATSELRVWSLHPGAVSTRLGANNGGVSKLVIPLLSLFFRSPERGARTSIYLCSEPEIDAPSGSYFVDEKLANVSALARDKALARKLWRESERLVRLPVDGVWG